MSNTGLSRAISMQLNCFSTNLRLEDNKIIEKNDGVIRNQRLEIESLQDEKVRLQHTVVNFMMDCLNNNIPLPPSEKSNLQMQVHQPEPGLELKSQPQPQDTKRY